jgi:integrase
VTQIQSHHCRPFSTIADAFVARYASRHQRPKTLTETRRYIERYLKPAWGDMDIRDIGKPQVFAVLDAMVDRGTEVSANRCLATMRRLFNWCVERGYLHRSPTAGVRPPAREYPRSRVLSRAELAAVWQAANTLGYPAGAWVQVMIATGGQRVRDVVTMRRSELHGTLWRISAPTKSRAPHTVPLSPLARRLLDGCPPLPGDYVFSTTGGRKHIQSLSKIKRRLDRLSEVADWRYHDIRRTVATAFGDELALPPHIAEAVQNRRSGIVSGVVAIYNRAQYEQAKRDALEAWGAWLETIAASLPDIAD